MNPGSEVMAFSTWLKEDAVLPLLACSPLFLENSPLGRCEFPGELPSILVLP